MKAIGFGKTGVGKKRSNNEDSIYVDNELGVYIVCDGLGGYAAGEVASKTAIELCRKILYQEQDKLEKLRKPSVPDSVIILFIESVIHQVSQEIYKLSQTRQEYAKMATTLTMLVILEQRAIMGHIGDSSLYLIRDGK